jgi:hypothetical protein
MANQLFSKARQRFANKEIEWDSDTIKAWLVDNTYAFSEAHEFLASIAPTARIAEVALTTPTLVDGFCDGDPLVYTTVVATNPITRVVMYIDTGDPATSPLLANFDVINGFPIIADGDYTVYPDAGFGGYFRI